MLILYISTDALFLLSQLKFCVITNHTDPLLVFFSVLLLLNFCVELVMYWHRIRLVNLIEFFHRFVKFSTEEDALCAVRYMNNFQVESNNLVVCILLCSGT